MCLWPCLYGDCVCLRGRMQVCDCACVYCDCIVFVCVSGHVCMVIVGGCVVACMFVSVCLYCECVVFVCVPGHVCKVIVCVCVDVCMFANLCICACMVIVLPLYVYLAMLAW